MTKRTEAALANARAKKAGDRDYLDRALLELEREQLKVQGIAGREFAILRRAYADTPTTRGDLVTAVRLLRLRHERRQRKCSPTFTAEIVRFLGKFKAIPS